MSAPSPQEKVFFIFSSWIIAIHKPADTKITVNEHETSFSVVISEGSNLNLNTDSLTIPKESTEEGRHSILNNRATLYVTPLSQSNLKQLL